MPQNLCISVVKIAACPLSLLIFLGDGIAGFAIEGEQIVNLGEVDFFFVHRLEEVDGSLMGDPLSTLLGHEATSPAICAAGFGSLVWPYAGSAVTDHRELERKPLEGNELLG